MTVRHVRRLAISRIGRTGRRPAHQARRLRVLPSRGRRRAAAARALPASLAQRPPAAGSAGRIGVPVTVANVVRGSAVTLDVEGGSRPTEATRCASLVLNSTTALGDLPVL